MDTKREHRAHAEGSPRGKPCDLSHSPSGRLIGKFRDNNSVTLSASVDMAYGYCNDYQPHAVKRMFDYKNGMLYDMRWDEAGNLGQVSLSKTEKMFEAGRFLFWTEDNRMHAAVDDRYYSYYAYDHSGGSCGSREQSQACLSYAEMEQRRRSQRRLKLTGDNKLLDVNADFMATYTTLNEPTLYPSAYMVLTNKGYTKHYYAGTERVAARIGGGCLDVKTIEDNPELQKRANMLFDQSREQILYRKLPENDLDCIVGNELAIDEFKECIKEIPGRVEAEVQIDIEPFQKIMHYMVEECDKEPVVFFYHSDHLGSASWITEINGDAVQHLQYLPYGERYVDQRVSGYHERFTFTGKERDEETGYGYFGARYMDHELMTMWLSVDPMSDKYPSISPYAYCAWNPIKLVDPDGMEIWINNGNGKFKYTAGTSSEGLKGFAKKAVDALNDIYNKGGDEGVDLINTLCSSKNIFNIKEQKTDKVSEFNASNTTDAYARNNQSFIDHWQDYFKLGHKFGSGGDVMWNAEGYMIFTENGLRNNPTYQLLHELCHAYDANFGTMDDRLFNGLEMKEWSACMKANCIGSSMGFPQQTIYGGSIDKKTGRYIQCSGTALFDAGDLINPFIDF